jgi:hypothetical protein
MKISRLHADAHGAKLLQFNRFTYPTLISVIIGCEVLYGNRSVWPHLWECIRSSCAPENSLLYLCVTLRNARLDVDDFTSQYLMPNFSSVTECALSPLVVAVRAERLKL